MTALGIALLVVGAVLLVVEAHVPTAGVLGVLGVVALGAGGWLALTGAGAAVALAVAVAVVVTLIAGGFLLFAGAKVLRARGSRIHGGPEGLVGHVGTARGPERVFVDGALWQARLSWPGDHGELNRGDAVVVERVTGLTLCVRKADQWELEA
ncbi:MAG TPA: NfeD family protein [Solirubrobacteraceae bacterium]|jgi:membrane-bound serine protease (ClpP class)|nr:NfeD family protein [Solirubrobacteraceae bacterium]